MRGLRHLLQALVGWLDRKFPDRMTTHEVDLRLRDLHARLEKLEQALPQMRVDIAKCKIMQGVEQILGVSD